MTVGGVTSEKGYRVKRNYHETLATNMFGGFTLPYTWTKHASPFNFLPWLTRWREALQLLDVSRLEEPVARRSVTF